MKKYNSFVTEAKETLRGDLLDQADFEEFDRLDLYKFIELLCELLGCKVRIYRNYVTINNKNEETLEIYWADQSIFNINSFEYVDHLFWKYSVRKNKNFDRLRGYTFFLPETSFKSEEVDNLFDFLADKKFADKIVIKDQHFTYETAYAMHKFPLSNIKNEYDKWKITKRFDL